MSDDQKPKLMVMTLGGTVEPLKKSIAAHKPEKVILLASHDSAHLTGKVLDGLDEKPGIRYEITEDPNSITECYRKAKKCFERAKKSGIPMDRILVDYTGGTKAMTAAVVLAAVGSTLRFVYVGGKERTKNGVGVVIDGKEEFFEEINPWSIFAEEERGQVITLFNLGNFDAVAEVVKNACQRALPPEIRSYFRFILPLCQGFAAWDQFQHKAAKQSLKEGLDLLLQHLEHYPEAGLRVFKERLESCLGFLNNLLRETHGLNRFHFFLVTDLLNNAARRIEGGRFDDAAARIYRALELYGQIVFTHATGLTNDGVPLEAVPLDLKDTFRQKYQDEETQMLKLPLSATFEFLKTIGNPAGIAFFEKMAEMKKIQSSRNKSILAHGIEPVTEKGVRSIFATVSNFVGATDVIAFPTLPGISEALENPPADAC
ncbi:MAG: TIGR02710 family CRISPR-associated protein [Deltaproteobacteria bacterium]|nr:TIGR02710 family CRISPR-associated protein [Deltaproteobacteria bacterium]MBW2132854.1 TIGR02710 family CRISPR-associated protein [Deltaproteobacteria bacterium]